MGYLLDTNIILYHLGDVSDAVEFVSRLVPDGIAISAVTYMEVYQGVLRSDERIQVESQLEQFLGAVPILPFSTTTARRCAELRDDLAREGKRVRQRALDLLIAATALEHGLVLVTRNESDFADIPDLQALFYTPI